MPGVDWIPGVSQIKSTFQLITGDVEGAARTQENFVKECPVVSQVTSVVQVIAGDTDGALDTQKRCLGTINNVANGIPVVGHVKGAIHHIAGDHEGGNQALNAATRTSVVLGTGVVAGIATGGIGAVAVVGGIAAGTVYDTTDSVISEKPKGVIAAVDTVVNSPDAGNIFDAAAAFAGDGLTGYAGGRLGTKVANQVKVNNLESARAVKTEQLNAGLFPEDGGGSSSMTSGQLTSLGQEINTLTNKINNIRHGLPQYYWDPKTHQVVVENPGSVNAAPFAAGHQDNHQEQSNQKDATRNKRPTTIVSEETGLDVDIYSGEEVDGGLTEAQKSQKLGDFKTQQTGQKELSDSIRNATTKISKQDEFEPFRKRDDDPKKNSDEKRMAQLLTPAWLHVRMPQQFGFTAAGLLNSTLTGFLHTFIRHWNQFLPHIPALQEIMAEIPEIADLLNTIVTATARDVAGNAINALEQFLDGLNTTNPERFLGIRASLLRAQLLIHQFIQNNITFENYIEDGINGRGQVQIYFRIGNQILVICISRELYPPVAEFNDGRPVRTIISAYFITQDDLDNGNTRAGRAWGS